MNRNYLTSIIFVICSLIFINPINNAHALPENNELTVTEDDYRSAAEKIFKVHQTLTDKYPLGDELSLGMYILNYLSELGTYTVPNGDIMGLIKSLELLMGEPFDPIFNELMSQISSLEFINSDGVKSVKVLTIDRKTIKLSMEETEDSTDQLRYIEIKDGSVLTFSDIKSENALSNLSDFIKNKVRILFATPKSLNLIHPEIIENIDSYIESEKSVTPLKVRFSGVYANVSTQSIFGKENFKFKKAVILPGLTGENGPLPIFIIKAKSAFLKTKVSVDQ